MKIQILSYRLPTATPDPTRHSSCGWIALIDDTEVGWCNMSFLPNKVIELEDAFIKFDYRGKGIYKKLWWTRWEYLNEHFKDHKIIAYCKPTTLEFYKKRGFDVKETITLMEKYI